MEVSGLANTQPLCLRVKVLPAPIEKEAGGM
jgi:hypothetical protein